MARPGPVNRALVVAIPVLAVLWSRLVLTWFLAPAHLLLVGVGWVVLAGAVAATRSWWVAIAVAGASTLRAILLLAVLAVRGPGGYWFAFWTEPGRRSAYVSCRSSSSAGCWRAWCGRWPVGGPAPSIGGRSRCRRSHPRGVGGLLGAIGLEDALTTWNDQLALLPWGLSRILGITVYLGIPTSLPWYLVGAGASALVAATVLGTRARAAR